MHDGAVVPIVTAVQQKACHETLQRCSLLTWALHCHPWLLSFRKSRGCRVVASTPLFQGSEPAVSPILGFCACDGLYEGILH